MRWAAILLVNGYRLLVSPLLPSACRYEPTCSEYMIEALREHGLLKGGAAGVKRLLRCHPWGGRGYDPVKRGPGDHGGCTHD